jgi:transposase
VLKEELFFILYDVTTLYFESFKADDLRSLGFSKDDKSKQPQIVVGLLATKSGFPLAHEVFPGKTFEGRTILPVLEKFSKKHGIEMPIVVADAAMLSKDNIKELGDRKMNYIVGARLANTSPSFIRKVNMALSREDGKIVRFPTNRHGDMICSFSLKRYRKDKLEMEKQIERAKRLIVKNEDGRRAKFVKKAEGAVVFNQELVAKTEELLGIKGYCTNIPESTLSNNQVIEFYHSLWNVEYAFRMSKHDIQARPIFHRESDAVRAHILLCFIALMIGRYLEIISGMSLRKATDLLWSIEEAHLEDTVTHEIFTLRMPLDPINRSPLGDLVKKWNC